MAGLFNPHISWHHFWLGPKADGKLCFLNSCVQKTAMIYVSQLRDLRYRTHPENDKSFNILVGFLGGGEGGWNLPRSVALVSRVP